MGTIVKKIGAKGRVAYLNTKTHKFTSEAAYKRQNKSKAKPLAKHQARKGGKPSAANCSTHGFNLVIKQTSKAGKGLRRCR